MTPPPPQLVHNLSFSHSCGGMPPSAQSICTDMRKYASWLHFINRNTENQSQTMNCYRNNSTLQCLSASHLKHVMVTAEVLETAPSAVWEIHNTAVKAESFWMCLPMKFSICKTQSLKTGGLVESSFQDLGLPHPLLLFPKQYRGSMLHSRLSRNQLYVETSSGGIQD